MARMQKASLQLRSSLTHDAIKHAALAGETITIEDMLKLPCDIFIPAAVPDVIDESVARQLNCRYVVEAANGPTTVEGDKVTA